MNDKIRVNANSADKIREDLRALMDAVGDMAEYTPPATDRRMTYVKAYRKLQEVANILQRAH